MSDIQVTPLGAGQDVGRSCIIVNILNKRIMLDCGMHMGYQDEKKFPDFNFIAKGQPLDNALDCVIISHFHLDHCGALPYMTEMVGYNKPIFMTLPTKAIAPIQLEDMRKIANDRQKDEVMFTSEMITKCFSKVIAVNLNQSIMVDDDITIKAYYAGHVLGAAMFEVRVKHLSFVYTGDYNMAPDRHLGSAYIDCCYPDLLITETTYATTIRDNKYVRERDFLKKLTQCLKNGGKVLIPVFALGRAQEICLLLENYWERMNLDVPIYFSGRIAEKSMDYYKLFVSWMNQRIKHNFYKHNVFNFRHIKPLDRSYIDMPGPMVVLASPGMLHAGQSLQIFKKWCNDEKNMVIVPGYCVKGTYGHRILSGEKKINFEPNNPNGKVHEIKMAIEYLSFSGHADSKGIMQLINMCKPANVLLVHGEAAKMQFFKQKVTNEFGIPCFNPDNGETALVPVQKLIPVDIDYKLFKSSQNTPSIFNEQLRDIQGIIGLDGTSDRLKLCSKKKFVDDNDLDDHNLRMTFSIDIKEELPIAKLILKLNQILSELGIVTDLLNTKNEKVYSVFNSLWIKIHEKGKLCKKITLSWLIEDDAISQKFTRELVDSLQKS